MFGGLKKKSGKKAAAQAVDVPELPTELRFSPRRNVFADLSLQTSNGQDMKGVVLDVSQCGARLRFVAADCMTERVRIDIPRLKIKKSARVRWRTRTDIGVEFLS
ncbi:MAG: PilZ domain-containing protein [Pseudomonadota bacterium]